jgi:hypothetical protein
MNLFRYFWIVLLAFVAVSSAFETYTAFEWASLFLALGFGLIAFGAWFNNTLIWPYEVSADYVPRTSVLVSRSVFGLGQALVCIGLAIKLIQALWV